MPKKKLEWYLQGTFKFGGIPPADVSLYKTEYMGASITKIKLKSGTTSYGFANDPYLREFESEEELLRVVEMERSGENE